MKLMSLRYGRDDGRGLRRGTTPLPRGVRTDPGGPCPPDPVRPVACGAGGGGDAGAAGVVREGVRRTAGDGWGVTSAVEEDRLVSQGGTPGLVRAPGSDGRRGPGSPRVPNTGDVRPVADAGVRDGAVRPAAHFHCGGGRAREGEVEPPTAVPGARRPDVHRGSGRELPAQRGGRSRRDARPVRTPAGRGPTAEHPRADRSVQPPRNRPSRRLDVADPAARKPRVGVLGVARPWPSLRRSGPLSAACPDL